MQDPDGRDQAARKAHAAELVASWGARCGISQAIEATPEALITRSRITDRWGCLMQEASEPCWAAGCLDSAAYCCLHRQALRLDVLPSAS